MGVFDRLRRLIRSNLNDVIRQAEDPEKVLNQVIVDMTQQLAEAKRNVASAIAEEKRIERQVHQMREAGAEWERRAMVALRAGKEELAREALTRKKREDDYASQLHEQWQKQHHGVEELKNSLRGLQDRIEEAQRKKTLLVARAKRAEAQKKIQELVQGIGDTSAFDAFDEMAKRVEQLETESEAIAELDTGRGDQSLEAQIAALEGGSSDEMLEDLRRKMLAAGGNPDVDHVVGGSTSDPDVDSSLEELKRRMREATGQ